MGQDPPIKVQTRCKKIWYGNGYGGFYVNPDLLNSSSIVYSIGIGEDISFDLDVIKTIRALCLVLILLQEVCNG